MSDLFYMLLATALFQNLLLSTGFGSSIMLRVIRRPRDIVPLGALMCVFSTTMVLCVYPIDMLIGNGTTAKLLRPLVMVVIASLLYIAVTLLTRRFLSGFYAHMQRLLSLAVFNNLTIGVTLIANHRVVLTLSGTIGLALGSCIGFMLLGALTVVGRERMDHPDVPQAFRGLPLTLLYLGLTALALLGFGTGALV